MTQQAGGGATAGDARRSTARASGRVGRVGRPGRAAARRDRDRRDDEQWVRDFVEEEYRQVVGTVQLVSGSRALAEEAVQEALARAWERHLRGDPIDRLGAWVTTVALNLARSGLRRRKVERAARSRLVVDPRLDDHATAGAEAQVVRDALRALPRRQREVTVLRYYGGLDVAEIAADLGIAEGTVKAMLFRARASLAAALGREDDR